MKIAERKILYALESGMKISRISAHLHCCDQTGKHSVQIPLSYLCGLVVSERVAISPAVLVGAARGGIPVTFVANDGAVSGIFTPVRHRTGLHYFY